MKRLAVPALLLAACVAPADDDTPQSEPGEGTTAISIRTEQVPEVVAVREGTDGPWLRARRQSPTEYQVFVRGPYSVIGACGRTLRVLSQTLADPHEITLDCGLIKDARLEVSGQMVQPGSVRLGSASARSDKPSWSFLMRLPAAGVFDLVAVTSDRVLVRENLEVRQAMQLPQLDLSNAPLLTSAQFTVTNAIDGEAIGVTSYLVGPRLGYAPLASGPLEGTKVAPPSLLSTSVSQRIGVVGQRTEASRYVSRSTSHPFQVGDPTIVTLWNGLTEVSFDASSGEPMLGWAARADDIEHLRYEILQQRSYQMDVSGNYLRAMQPEHLGFDMESVPGLAAQWRLSLQSSYSVSVNARRGTSVRDSYLVWQQHP